MITILYRIQVEYGPLTKIAIFRPDETHLPDEKKTYLTEFQLGLLGDKPADELLKAEDLFTEGNNVGVDLTRYQQRTGLSEPSNFNMEANELRKFLEELKNRNND